MIVISPQSCNTGETHKVQECILEALYQLEASKHLDPKNSLGERQQTLVDFDWI